MNLLHIKTALRSLAKQRMVTSINLFGLTVGMTASVLIFLWVRNELSYDRFHKDADRIYRVTTHYSVNKGEWWVWETSSAPVDDVAQNEMTGVVGFGRVTGNKWFSPVVHLKGRDVFQEPSCAFVDKGWFDLFHYDLIQGSLPTFLNDPGGLILTESAAHKYFGAGEPIGQVIQLDSVLCTVRAVVRDNPTNSSFQYPILRNRLLRLRDSTIRADEAGWGEANYTGFVKLAPGVDPQSFGNRLTEIVHKATKETRDRSYYTLEPLTQMHFESDLTVDSDFKQEDRTTVYIFSLLGIVLLGIACINYVNLTTARATTRAKEVGVRKVLGARRGNLLGQFITESALVSIAALLLSLVLVRLLMPAFDDLTQTHFQYSLDSLWLVLGGTLCATILLNSLYPALLLSSFQPIKVIKGNLLLKMKDGLLRKTLVVIQFSVTLILLVGTLVIGGQMRYIRAQSPHFEQSRLFQLELPPSIWVANNYDWTRLSGMNLALRNDLLAHPEIARVSISNGDIINLENQTSGSIDFDGRPKDFKPVVTRLETDSDFFKIFHLQMAEGRWLNGYKATDAHHYILNETAVKEWHIHTPVVGQRFVMRHDTGTIVGVVRDFHYRSMRDKIKPLVAYATQGFQTSIIIEASGGKTQQAQAIARRIWAADFPGSPFTYTFLEDTYRTVYRKDLSAATLFQVFSWIAILISALGLFGLVSFMAAQRTREIGIRKVLGASITQLVTLLSREFLILVGLATAVGIPIAWWAAHAWLQGFAYRIIPGWWMFGLGALISLVIALATVCTQALKSAGANPIKSLRTE